MLSIQYEIFNLVTNIILIIFVLIFFSIFFKRKKLLYILITIFYILSLPVTYKLPLYYLENNSFSCSNQNIQADLIVILGGGLTKNNNFGNTPTVTRRVNERIRYGVFMHKKYNIPILVSGGDVFNIGYNEADIMKNIIKKEYNEKVKFIENNSKTTNENAKFVSNIIKQNNIKSILLISNSWHLKRATFLFKKYNPNIKIKACSGYYYSNKHFSVNYKDFLPSMKSFYFHEINLREWIALFWYKYINNTPSRVLY